MSFVRLNFIFLRSYSLCIMYKIFLINQWTNVKLLSNIPNLFLNVCLIII